MVTRLAAVAMMIVGSAALGAQGDQDRAKDLFNQARAEADPKRRVELLRASVTAYESFEGTVMLGDALIRVGEPLEARKRCNHAFDTLVNPEAPQSRRLQAIALVCVARSYRATRERGTAIVVLKRSLELERTTQAEQELREIIDTGVKTARDIAAEIAVTPASTGLARGAIVEASADVYVTFDFDKASLRPEGEQQVREIAAALEMLGQRGLGRARYSIIGHTDLRGTDAYNDDLSMRRARTVKDLLVSKYGVPQTELVVEGRGKREPLLSGTSDEDHARNRRVEIQRIQQD